jgi:hypothetical protein
MLDQRFGVTTEQSLIKTAGFNVVPTVPAALERAR